MSTNPNFKRFKPKNDFGKEIDNFRALTGMPATALANNAGVKYSTLIDTTTGRCAGHELKPIVREYMENYLKENGIA